MITSMYYVYILKGYMRHPLYIGVTNDLRRRFAQHIGGVSTHTRKSPEWTLVYYEAYASREDAVEREHALKQFGSAYGHLKQRIKKSIAMRKSGIQ